MANKQPDIIVHTEYPNGLPTGVSLMLSLGPKYMIEVGASDRQQELPLLPADPGPQSDIDWPPDLSDYADAVQKQADEKPRLTDYFSTTERAIEASIAEAALPPWVVDDGPRGPTSATEIVVAGLNVEARKRQSS